MSNTTFTDNLVSYDGDGADMNITGATATTLNTKGGDINVTGGIGNGIGDGGDIIITAGPDGGGGTQGTITFSALDNTSSLAFNETGDEDLLPSFTADSIVGALNELKDSTSIIKQNIYTNVVNLNYNGSTPVDIPGTVDILNGTWLINYSITFTTSDPTIPVAIYVRDSSNVIIEESKTFINDNGSSQRHTVTKQFVYTEALASNKLKVSFQLNTGVAGTVAVEMDAMSGSTNPDQIPLIWVARIKGTFEQNTYTTVTDLDYNGTTEVDVPGTITLTAGDWLIGYSLTLRTPSVADDILVYIQDAANNPVSTSKTFLTKNITTIRHTVTKAFVFTASATDYRLTFKLNSTGTISPAVEMSALSGVADPDQVPVLWAIDLSSFTNAQNTYTTVSNINYNGTTEVDIPGTITLTSGYWITGYTLAMNAPNVSDSMLVHIRDSSNNIINLSKTFVTEASTTSRHTISRSFLLSQVLESEDYKVSFRLNASADTSVAVEMSGFSGADPDQVPVLWAVKIGDIGIGDTFLSLTDTPNSYVGQANKLVYVNPTETSLEFSLLTAGTNDDLDLSLPSTLELGAANLTQLNTRLISGGHILVQSGTFTLTSTINIPDNCVIDGSGNEQTVFTRTGNLAMFNLGNNVTIKNCKFDGNSFQGIVLTLDGDINCTIENCTFVDCLVDSVIAVQNGSNGLNVSGCRFSGTTGNCITVSGTTSSELIVSDCYISNTSVDDCIDLANVNGCTLTGNTFESATRTLLNGTNITFSDNVIQDSVGNGIFVSGTNVIISKCTINNTTSTCIESSGTNISILGNIIDTSSSNGMLISGTGDHNISDNTIRNVGSAIRLIGTGDYIVGGNTISDNSALGLDITSSSSNITVTGNLIKNNLSRGILSVGSGTISGNTLENNGNGTFHNIEIGNNSGNVIIEDNRIIDTSLSTPSFNINVGGTGNDDTVCVRSNMATSLPNAAGALNPYDDNVLCDPGAYTLPDITTVSTGHRIFISAISGGVTVTPTNFFNFTSVSLSAVNDNVILEWNGYEWILIGSTNPPSNPPISHYFATGNELLSPGVASRLTFNSIISSANITQDGSDLFHFTETGFYQVTFGFTCSPNGGTYTIRGFINYSGDSVDWGLINIVNDSANEVQSIVSTSVIRVASTSETVRCIGFQDSATFENLDNLFINITFINPL